MAHTADVTSPSMTSVREEGLVEMAWDPITRIVGSLGIYTKMDFKNKVVKECYSSSHVFRGYSVFMKGMNLSGKPGMVHAMQMPPTFGQPPMPLIHPRLGTLHLTTGPQQPIFTRHFWLL